MSFCFAFRSTDSALLAPAIAPFGDVLQLEDGAPHGWGLGYYQSGQPLLRKQPKAVKQAFDFREGAKNLRASLLLGHRRGMPLGPLVTENTHPFRFRSWVFSHCGTVDRFDDIRPDLLSAVPDFIRRNIRGDTDSEHLFHLFLAFLNDTGRLDDRHLTGEQAGRALSAALTYLDRLVKDCGGSPSDHCCLLTNGGPLIATHRGIPLHVTRHNVYSNVGRGQNDKPLSYPHLRSVLIVGGPTPRGPGWESVDENVIASVDRELNIEYLSVAGDP